MCAQVQKEEGAAGALRIQPPMTHAKHTCCYVPVHVRRSGRALPRRCCPPPPAGASRCCGGGRARPLRGPAQPRQQCSRLPTRRCLGTCRYAAVPMRQAPSAQAPHCQARHFVGFAGTDRRAHLLAVPLIPLVPGPSAHWLRSGIRCATAPLRAPAGGGVCQKGHGPAWACVASFAFAAESSMRDWPPWLDSDRRRERMPPVAVLCAFNPADRVQVWVCVYGCVCECVSPVGAHYVMDVMDDMLWMICNGCVCECVSPVGAHYVAVLEGPAWAPRGRGIAAQASVGGE